MMLKVVFMMLMVLLVFFSAYSLGSHGSLPQLGLPAPPVSAEPMWCPPGGPPPLALCLHEQEFNALMVSQKKKVSCCFLFWGSPY